MKTFEVTIFHFGCIIFLVLGVVWDEVYFDCLPETWFLCGNESLGILVTFVGFLLVWTLVVKVGTIAVTATAVFATV